jgi:hypothetical protein
MGDLLLDELLLLCQKLLTLAVAFVDNFEDLLVNDTVGLL